MAETNKTPTEETQDQYIVQPPTSSFVIPEPTPVAATPNATPIQKPGNKNANLNFQMYGDDSSPENQGTPGGLYNKFTGEGVDTSQLNYNPNLNTSQLGDMAF